MRKLDTMEKFPETVEVEVLPVMECKLTDHRGPVRRFFGMFNPFKFRRRAGIRIDFLTLLLEAIYHAIDHQLGLFRQRVKRMDEAFIAYGETVEVRLKIAREELDRLEQRANIATTSIGRLFSKAELSRQAINKLRNRAYEAEGFLKIAREELDRLEQRADIATVRLDRFEKAIIHKEVAIRDLREKLAENEAKDTELRAQVLEALKRFDARLEAVENSAKKPAPRVAKSPYTPRKTPVRKGVKR